MNSQMVGTTVGHVKTLAFLMSEIVIQITTVLLTPLISSLATEGST